LVRLRDFALARPRKLLEIYVYEGMSAPNWPGPGGSP
jgi:hypothetical protein